MKSRGRVIEDGGGGFLLPSLILLSSSLLAVHAQPASQFPQVDPNHYQPSESGSSCYDRNREAQRCVPDFINAAFNLHVEVTNTCGVTSPTKYCVQSGHSNMRSVCETCDDRDPTRAHPAKYLTDFNNINHETWWSSETMNEKMQYPNVVNLTLHLGKSFDITYVRLKFVSPRPESFVIYKKTCAECDWEAWQYYSGSCRATYNMTDKDPILPGNEAVAQCTKEFSDISPITGGNIAFSTLENRPSAHEFEDSEVLQQWVTATSIRISLTRMNTFGDEVFGDRNVLMSYYYAVSDFAVGGRCKCNGHSSQCVESSALDGARRLVCQCQHNTEGADCGTCKPFYNDLPWRAATSMEANECKACDCNGLANRCFFDAALFEETGHGGHCLDCQGNTGGNHCEECLPHYFRSVDPRTNQSLNYCSACQCNAQGSLSEQCSSQGKCACKDGVGGRRCDECLPGYFGFGPNGCSPCNCVLEGSFNNEQLCDVESGMCTCKVNVEGEKCNKCKPGHFDLNTDNEFGCTPCLCFGHSSVCDSATGQYKSNISSVFSSDKQKWGATANGAAVDSQWAELDEAVAVSDSQGAMVYFMAPEQFLGDQRSSYNQHLVFSLRVNHEGAHATVKDVVIKGGDGKELHTTIHSQGNPLPTTSFQDYKFRIHSNPEYRWSPRLNELEFLAVLANVTEMKIRATYGPSDIGFLHSVHLASSATASASDAPVATWIESCTCPEPYVGQFCESCATGFKRVDRFGGRFVSCIACECHGHSKSCDAESGACICEHNTAGDTCERCARGYYGNALNGNATDCQPCPCPGGGACALHSDGEVMCTECPEGYTGRRCDECADGFFGNPKEKIECAACVCNGNVDANSINNCDKITGKCLKCVYKTVGDHCERCLPGYWGNALQEPKGNCQQCECYHPGTRKPNNEYTVLECSQDDGQCDCYPHIIGFKCDTAEPGFFNITSGAGGIACDCDPIGSVNSTCDVSTGQCTCKPGVTGRRCDECAPYNFGFSSTGCEQCDCDPIGSESRQCDVNSGQCLCKESVVGRRCDVCEENRYNMQAGCLPCDDCYALIQDRVNVFRKSIRELNNTLTEIIENPAPVDDDEFKNKVDAVGEDVTTLVKQVQSTLEDHTADVVGKVSQLKKAVRDALTNVQDVDKLVEETKRTAAEAESNLARWKHIHRQAKDELERAMAYLDTEGKAQLEAATKARDAFGEHNEAMTKLAKETRDEAEKQEKKAEEIERLAIEARDKARAAHTEAKDAIFGGQNISHQISEMKRQEEELKVSLEATKELARKHKKEAEEANRAAAEALTTVEGLRLPAVNATKLNEDAVKLVAEAKEAREAVRNEAENNKGIEEEGERVKAAARTALQSASDQQNVADTMLSDVDSAREKAEDAVKTAQETLKEAEETLKTLKGESIRDQRSSSSLSSEFSSRVETSKDKAKAELEKLAVIEETIQKADETTKQAEAAIGNAREDADASKELAVKAEEAAKAIAKEADELKKAAETSKGMAEKMEEDAEALANELNELNGTLTKYRDQTDSDKTLAAEAVSKATLAMGAAQRAANESTTELEKVRRLIAKLAGLDDVNSAELEQLDKLCTDTEEWLNAAERENELTKMREEKTKMDGALNDLKKDLEGIKREIGTMQNVLTHIPNECYNRIDLEQEGQKKRRR